MEAKLVQVGEVVVVHVNGRLDIDKTSPFKEACFKNLLDKKVVFNFQQLSFVGSTGIQNFFQAIREIHAKNKYGVRIAGMTADFHRLWAVAQTELTIYENTNTALQSFFEPAIKEQFSEPTEAETATPSAQPADPKPERAS